MRLASSLLCLSIALAAAAAACSGAGTGSQGNEATTGGGVGGEGGSGGGGGMQPSGALLRIEPADAIVSPPEGKGAQIAYRAFYKPADGAEEDVTGEAKFSVDDITLGIFVSANFASNTGKLGKTTVRAKARGVEATTSLTLTKKTVVLAPGAPADAPSKFDGEGDPSTAPKLVYPPDGILVPPNMNSLEVHFVPAPGQTLFEIAFQAPTVTLAVYTPCQPLGGGCVYTPDKTFWSALADEARGGPQVSYTVRGVDGQSPGKVGTSAPQSIQFATEDIVGGLYYWNSAGAIQRFDFGLPGAQSETYLNNFTAGALTCVGCHVLSRDGTKIAVGLDIPVPAPFKVFDVATKQLVFQQGTTFGGGANFFAFSPDNKQILTSNGASIALNDAVTGKILLDPVLTQATMPDWGPDGNAVVFARPNSPPIAAVPGVDSASLQIIHFDGSAWSQPETLVPFEGQNNYYPSFSPDQNWVVFNRSPANKNSFDNGSTDGGNVPDGQVWAVPTKGGPAVRLERSSPGGDQWPKWSTAITTYAGGDVMWLTFSSRRPYGLRLPGGGQAQLWMTAFDPKKAAAGQDPSFPAFWLPFQDIGTGNHIAQWVTKVVRKPCKQKSECEGTEVCQEGSCLPDIK